MQAHEEEYIAYRPDKYIQTGDNPNVEDEDEFAFERALPSFKWNQFVNDYNSLATSDISFKRVKRQDEAPPAEEAPPADKPPEDAAAPPAEGAGGGEAAPSTPPPKLKLFMVPIYAITGAFAIMFIFGLILIPRGPNRGIVQSSIMLSAFCMWIFWVTVYIGQMNPLLGPRLHNTTVAWLSFKVGNPVKPAAPPPAAAPE